MNGGTNSWIALRSAVLIAFCLGCGFRATAADDLLARFRSEAPKAWQSYQSAVANAQIESTFRIVTVKSGAVTYDFLAEYIVKSTSSQSLFVRTDRDSTPGRAESAESSVHCISGRDAFSLSRIDERPWYLIYYGPSNDAIRRKLEIDGLPIRLYALWLSDRSLMHVAGEVGFKVSRCEAVAGDEGDLVRVHFTFHPREGDFSGMRSGWVDLDPAQFWTVRKFQTRGLTKVGDVEPTNTATAEFEYMPKGSASVPIVRRRILRTVYPSEPEKQATWTSEITRFDLTAAPDADFTPQAFGVEISPPTVSLSRKVMLYFTAGLVLLFLALSLRRWANLKRDVAPAS